MKITNKTKYRTIDLSRIIRAALSENSKIEGRINHKWLRIDIVPNQGNGCSGFAHLGGHYMRLRIHPTNESPSDLAWLFIHELYHIRGFNHDQMGSFNHYNHKAWSHYNLDFKLELKAAKPKPVRDLQVERYNHVLKMFNKKSNQIKRLKNQLKKWSVKKTYYEKVLKAAGKI